MFRPREMAKTGAFSRVPKAPFLGASNTAPDRNPLICRALRPWGLDGWWRRTGRHFSSGRHQRVASRESRGRPWRAGSACASTDICLYDLPKLKTPHRPLPDRPLDEAASPREGSTGLGRSRGFVQTGFPIGFAIRKPLSIFRAANHVRRQAMGRAQGADR